MVIVNGELHGGVGGRIRSVSREKKAQLGRIFLVRALRMLSRRIFRGALSGQMQEGGQGKAQTGAVNILPSKLNVELSSIIFFCAEGAN